MSKTTDEVRQTRVDYSALVVRSPNSHEPLGQMLCPYCQDSHIHHEVVVVYGREHEDGPSFQIDTGLAYPEWVSDDEGGNPSPRRNGLRIFFWGECSHKWALDIYQHKGETFLSVKGFSEPSEIDLVSMPYAQYLKTEHWQSVREAALARAGHRCQLCNASERLDVHHRTYENRGNEEDGDLTVLCRECHSKFHDKLPQGNDL